MTSFHVNAYASEESFDLGDVSFEEVCSTKLDAETTAQCLAKQGYWVAVYSGNGEYSHSYPPARR